MDTNNRNAVFYTFGFCIPWAIDTRFRPVDLWWELDKAGVRAIPIVCLISFMIGLIIAFVGNMQLKLFGAEIYVAALVAISMIRILGAIMTGIIMAGRTVSVPQSVDRPQIVIKQKDSNMMIVSEFDRWIEGLNTALPVAISENMNMYAKNINARPIKNSNDAVNSKYLVSIDFVRFETESNGKTTVSAWWTVSDNRGNTLVQKKTTQNADTPEMKSGTPNYDATVALYSKLVAKTSYKIADIISELN